MTGLQFAMFFAVALTIWALGHLYLGLRLIRRSRMRAAWKRRAWVALAVIAIVPLASFAAGRALPDTVMWAPLQWVGFIFMGLSTLLVVFTIAVDLLHWATRLSMRVLASSNTGSQIDQLADPERRLFMREVVNAGVVGSAGVLTGAGIVAARQAPQVVEVDVPIPNLPAALEGFRIAQITDLHIGPTIGRDHMQASVDVANSLDADLVAVTGDLIDGMVHHLAHDVAPLGDLRARHGAYYVTGNHEYYWDPEGWCEEVARLGLTVLRNEHRLIDHDGGRVVLAGVTDHRAGRYRESDASDPAKAVHGAPEADVRVLLAHQPRSIYGAQSAGFDLQISGHTHGGQYFPFNIFVHLTQPYVAGLHLHESTWIYVNQGTGYWGPPNRIGVPAEVSLIRLVRA